MPNKITKKYLEIWHEGYDNPEVCFTEKTKVKIPVYESQFETPVTGGCPGNLGSTTFPPHYAKSCYVWDYERPTCLFCTYTVSYKYKNVYTTTCFNTSTPGYNETKSDIGWNNSAVSYTYLHDNEVFEFTPPISPHDIFIGLTNTSGYETWYGNIKYGFNFNSLTGVCRVGAVYNGQVINNFSCPAGTRCSIQKGKDVINLYVNNLKIASFFMGPEDNAPTSYKYYPSMLIDLALYNSDDYIENATITAVAGVCGESNGSSLVLGGASLGAATNISGIGVKGIGYACATAVDYSCASSQGIGISIASEYSQGLSAISEGKSTVCTGNFNRSSVSFNPLITNASEYVNNRSITEFEPFTSSAGIDLRDLAYNKAKVSFRRFYSNGYIVSQQLLQGASSFEPFISFGADFNAARSITTMEPLTARGGWFETADGKALLKVPRHILSAHGYSEKLNEAYLGVPKFSINAQSGAQIRFNTPQLTLDMQWTTDIVARAKINVPKITVTGELYVGGAGRAYIDVPNLSLSANCGAVALDLKVPKLTLEGVGKLGTVLNSQIIVPQHSLYGEVNVGDVGNAELIVPPVSMLSGILRVDWGSYSIKAHGYMETVEVSEAYVMNTTNNAITKYDNYPFNNIITSNDNAYGVLDTGLYLLDGDLDEAAIINAEFELHPTNYDTLQTKNVPYVYVSARSEDSFMVGTRPDERVIDYEPSNSHGINNLFNWRAQLARGVKAINWGYTIKNINGSDFQIQSLKSMPAIHKRRL